MKSNNTPNAEWILDRVLRRLHPDYLLTAIVQPLVDAGDSFDDPEEPIGSYLEFNRIVGQFVQHLHSVGLHQGYDLDLWEAEATGITALEQGYESGSVSGYEAALQDTLNRPSQSVRRVLGSVQQFFIQQARSQYIQWVVTTQISLRSWETRVEMVRILLQREAEFLPADILPDSPELYVNSIPSLIFNCLNRDTALQQVLSGQKNFSPF